MNLPSQEACFKAAGAVAGRALARILSSSPREAALAAYIKGGPTLQDLERQVCMIQARHVGRKAAA